MSDNSEIQRLCGQIVSAMQLSTDHLTAAGTTEIPELRLESLAQTTHLARCIAAFTTDDGLVRDMAEIIDEAPTAMIGKVESARFAPELCTGELSDLEKNIWTRLYAGRRERSRILQMTARRSAA